MNSMKEPDDRFELYDLKVEVIGDEKTFVCSHRVGDYFLVEGGNLKFPDGQPFSMYAIAALLPLLPAKQRETDPNDWMTTDETIACPDANCGAKFRIARTQKRRFSHGDVSAEPLAE